MPTLAQLFAEGYSMGEAIPRTARARAAAKKQYGAAADDPALFSKLQQMEYAKTGEGRKDAYLGIAQSQNKRAEANASRAQGTYDFKMQGAKTTRRAQAVRGMLSGLRAARDRGEDLGQAFDKLHPVLDTLGVDPSDIPTMRAKLVENPAVLDDYLAAINGSTLLGKPAKQSATAVKEQIESENALQEAETAVGDILKRMDKLEDPSREAEGRSVFGAPGRGMFTRGGLGAFGTIPSSRAADYVTDLEALENDIRYGAFAKLKGGGQITEKESEFAAGAIAKIRRIGSYEKYREELANLRTYMEQVLENARLRAKGRKVPSASHSARTPATKKSGAAGTYPVGTVIEVDGVRYRKVGEGNGRDAYEEVK